MIWPDCLAVRLRARHRIALRGRSGRRVIARGMSWCNAFPLSSRICSLGPLRRRRLRGNRQMGRWNRMLVSARQHIRCASACARWGWRNAVPATSSRIIWESSCCICPSCAGVLRMRKLRRVVRRMRRSRSLSALCASIHFAGLVGFATRWRLRDLTAISCTCSIACALCWDGRLSSVRLAG